MRLARTFVLAFVSLVLASPLFSQTAVPSTQTSPQALTLLRNSLVALTGGKSITDVTLTGTARRIAGSDDESGTATYNAISGANRLDLSFSGGAHSEIANSTGAFPRGSWSGPDGVAHPMALHNLTNQASISPAFTLFALTSAQNSVVTLVGEEAKNGAPVYHISASQQFPRMRGSRAALSQRISQIDIFLDASTLLPVALDFNSHPDNDAALDIPAELLFFDYRTVNGVQIPFHVQKFLNGSLLLDLQFASARLNSGLSATNFTVEAGL